MNPSGSSPRYRPPGSPTVQLGMTRQKLSHRPRHVSPTRPRSRMMWSAPAAASSWLTESPACPAPTITVSTADVIDWRGATSGSIGARGPAPGAVEAALSTAPTSDPGGDSMFGRRALLPLFILVALLLSACGGSSSTAGSTKYSGTIHIASSTWTGYALLYLADKKGIWKTHGLDVNFKDVEDPNDRFIALAAGRLEGMASTVDAFARQQSNGVAAVEVFPIDASVGGDGILAKNTIQTVADLKGKTVGVNQGSVSEWFLAQVLEKNGLHLSDVKEQNMTSGAAGAAFVASKLDVAVTWEPWLTKATKARADGRVLVSSKEYPDLIMDSFAFRKDFVQKYPDTVKDFMKAYYEAFTWMQANQTEALKVIGDAVQESPSDVSADLSTLTLFDLSTGKQVIGTSSSHGKIYDNVKAAADFWKAQGKIDTAVN